MTVTLGTIAFDPVHTTVREKLEEVGGRDERIVTIDGLVLDFPSLDAVEARLDAILDAASLEDFTAELSLRAGRRLWVRRNAFKREIREDERVGTFTLELAARDSFEKSTAETVVPWTVAASGATLNVASAGTANALPRIALTASGTLIDPAVSDGIRTMTFSGSVLNGEVLTFDAAAGTVLRDAEDVTPYTTGRFPEIAPEGTILTYTDDAASSHAAAGTVTFRDRWW